MIKNRAVISGYNKKKLDICSVIWQITLKIIHI